MEIKKTSKASLENKKSNWLLVGYVIVLVFMFSVAHLLTASFVLV